MINKLPPAFQSRLFVMIAIPLIVPAVAAEEGEVEIETDLILEELVITATKRSDLIHDVPISVTAMAGDRIEDVGITSLEELTFYLPNVNVNKGQASPNLFIRGIGSGTNTGFEQSVGLYIDGVYSGRAQLATVPFTMDLYRVEVLKGPQGILFGKNTIGGAVNVSSAKPTSEFEGYVEALYEPQHGEEIVTAVVSGAMTDSVSGRLALRYESFDGWWENTLLNSEGPEKENVFARGTIRWEPSDNLEVLAKYENGDFSNENKPAVIYRSDQPLNSLGENVFPIVDDNDKAAFDFPNNNDFDTDVAAITVNWDLEHYTLTTITASSAYDYTEQTNADFSATSSLHRTKDESYDQFSQEVRLVSPGGETIDWIVGAYYQQSSLEVSRVNETLDFINSGPLAVTALVATEDGLPSEFDQDSTSWAGFGEVIWSIRENIKVGLGLRYNEETKELDKISLNPGMGARSGSLLVLARPRDQALIEDVRSHTFTGLKREEEKTTWATHVQWEATDDLMVYSSIKTGFKGGGYDEAYSGAGEIIRTGDIFTGVPDGGTLSGNDASILEYSEETVLAYEIGSKIILADGAAQLNLALFRMEYDDLQVSSLVGDVFRVSNAGESVSQGVEADWRWILTERLTFGGALAYLDAHYESFKGATCTVLQATDPDNNPGCLLEDGSNIAAGETGGQDLSGETLLYAPEWSANINFTYVYPLGDNLEFYSSLDFNYQDEFYSSLDLDPNTVHEANTKINARLALANSDDKWSVALIGKNLTNEKTSAWNNDVPLTDSNSYYSIPERPRSIAIQARYRFE